MGVREYRIKVRFLFAISRWYSDPGLVEREQWLQALSMAIKNYMRECNVYDDPVRTFFKTHVQDLTDLIEWIQKPIRSCLPSRFDPSFSLAVYESAKLINILYASTHHYRQEHAQLYAIGDVPLYEPWLATSKCLGQLQSQYELIEGVLLKFPDITLDAQSVALRGTPSTLLDDLRNQLCDTADNLLGAYNERLCFLERYGSLVTYISVPSQMQRFKSLWYSKTQFVLCIQN